MPKDKKTLGKAKKKQRLHSATMLHRLGEIEIEDDGQSDLDLLVRYSRGEITQDEYLDQIDLQHRVMRAKKDKKLPVFTGKTGHHEWMPTDMAGEVLATGNKYWRQLWYLLRSPTWLLIHANTDQLDRAADVNTEYFPGRASQLELFGHSGGLNDGGTQLTTHQEAFHNVLRGIARDHFQAEAAIADAHAKRAVYESYVDTLIAYIERQFAFLRGSPNALTLTTARYGVLGEEKLRMINFDLSLSVTGENPKGIETMQDVAEMINGNWTRTWLPYLRNSAKAVFFDLDYLRSSGPSGEDGVADGAGEKAAWLEKVSALHST